MPYPAALFGSGFQYLWHDSAVSLGVQAGEGIVCAGGGSPPAAADRDYQNSDLWRIVNANQAFWKDGEEHGRASAWKQLFSVVLTISSNYVGFLCQRK